MIRALEAKAMNLQVRHELCMPSPPLFTYEAPSFACKTMMVLGGVV